MRCGPAAAGHELLLGSSVSMRFRISSAGPSWPRAAQAVGGGGEKLPGFGFLVKPDINLGQTGAHGDVFRIHLQRLLENPYCLFEFAGAQKFFRNLQILRAGIIERDPVGCRARPVGARSPRWVCSLVSFLYMAMALTVKPCAA